MEINLDKYDLSADERQLMTGLIKIIETSLNGNTEAIFEVKLSSALFFQGLVVATLTTDKPFKKYCDLCMGCGVRLIEIVADVGVEGLQEYLKEFNDNLTR